MGGTNEDINIVTLTAREHYIAHKLLTYIYPGNNKLFYAFSCFVTRPLSYRNIIISSRDYEAIKSKLSRLRSIANSIMLNETKLKISNTLKEYFIDPNNRPNLGRRLTEEQKKHLSNINTGKHPSDETIEKLRESVNFAWADPELRERQRQKYIGKKQEKWAVDKRLAAIRAKGKRIVSEETRKKMSDAQAGISKGKKHVSVIQISLHNEIIKVWESHHDAAIEISAEPKNILKCCRGKIHTSKNFKWKFN
jgi:hypothetical protein